MEAGSAPPLLGPEPPSSATSKLLKSLKQGHPAPATQREEVDVSGANFHEPLVPAEHRSPKRQPVPTSHHLSLGRRPGPSPAAARNWQRPAPGVDSCQLRRTQQVGKRETSFTRTLFHHTARSVPVTLFVGPGGTELTPAGWQGLKALRKARNHQCDRAARSRYHSVRS